jgi:CAAX prenyl protease-like protein
MESRNPPYQAFIAPFAAYILLFGVGWLVQNLFKGSQSLLVTSPQYWVFPLQALVCGGVLAWFWRNYTFGPFRAMSLGFTVAIALLVLGIWISPQELFHFAPRKDGFDPTIFAQNPGLYGGVLGLRFLRLVVVVPLMEEVFWRGFLLRDFIDNSDFTKVAFGTFTPTSCVIVAGAFALAHWGPDFIPALVTGFLFNWVAYRTRSLGCCVLAHAITNLLLGCYILHTQQWGFW